MVFRIPLLMSLMRVDKKIPVLVVHSLVSGKISNLEGTIFKFKSLNIYYEHFNLRGFETG